jgi:uncharacterized protein YcbX
VTQQVIGRVEEIWVYPVRSMAGAARPSAEIGPDGLAGDRAFVVVDAGGSPVRGKDAPALRAAAATGDPDADALAATAALGRPARVVPAPHADGVAPVHLVSRQALAGAAAGRVPDGCSAEDPRANLVVALAAADDERAWVGRTVRVGDAVLELTRLPKHCLGVYAEVRRAGTVTVGDAVLL